MNNFSLLTTLGVGSIFAFVLFFSIHKLLKWEAKVASLLTAAIMLLLYVPLAVMHWAGIDVFAIHFAFYMMIPYGLGIIASVKKERINREGKDNAKGIHWIPAVIVVFFLTIATVDSIIITFATSGVEGDLAETILPATPHSDAGEGTQSKFTGNVSYDLQDEEEQFDQYVAQLNEQKKRGWQVTGGWKSPPMVSKDSVFNLVLRDKESAPLLGAKIEVQFLRSSDMSADQTFQLNGQGNGNYSIPVALQKAGCWKMNIIIRRDKDRHEVRGNSEVAEMIDGKRVERPCFDGEPDLNADYNG
ncbi:MAG: FixH family protein [Thiotrichaceae bacterium]|nr:FixH family protein [Thiotrichaceae bacterium]